MSVQAYRPLCSNDIEGKEHDRVCACLVRMLLSSLQHSFCLSSIQGHGLVTNDMFARLQCSCSRDQVKPATYESSAEKAVSEAAQQRFQQSCGLSTCESCCLQRYKQCELTEVKVQLRLTPQWKVTQILEVNAENKMVFDSADTPCVHCWTMQTCML